MRFPQHQNSISYDKIEDHGVRWGDMGRILARLTRMTLEMARKAGACFSVVNFMSCITVAK